VAEYLIAKIHQPGKNYDSRRFEWRFVGAVSKSTTGTFRRRAAGSRRDGYVALPQIHHRRTLLTSDYGSPDKSGRIWVSDLQIPPLHNLKKKKARNIRRFSHDLADHDDRVVPGTVSGKRLCRPGRGDKSSVLIASKPVTARASTAKVIKEQADLTDFGEKIWECKL